MTPTETYKLKDNHVLKIYQDDNPQSPREWDNLGIFYCSHKNYDLGDKDTGINSKDFSSWSEIEEYIKNKLEAPVCIPVYMYDHSGITVRTYPFDDRWDSDQIGFTYVTKDKLRKEYGVKKITKDIIETATKVLESEIEVLDQYVTGDVYGFRLFKVDKCNLEHEHETEIDSCWGFYGSDIKTNGIIDHINSELLTDELKVKVC